MRFLISSEDQSTTVLKNSTMVLICELQKIKQTHRVKSRDRTKKKLKKNPTKFPKRSAPGTALLFNVYYELCEGTAEILSE